MSLIKWPSGATLNAIAELDPHYSITDGDYLYVQKLQLRDVDANAFHNSMNLESIVKTLLASKPNYVGLYHDYPLCFFGFMSFWQGQAEGWMIVDKNISNHKFIFHRTAKKIIPEIMDRMYLHRLQFTVHSYNTQAVRWADVLQFEKEGLLRMYGPDKCDYLMLSKIRN